jgi:choline dehydrogenase-like flavoprotein
MADDISRREFVKQTVAGTAVLAGASAGALEAAAAAPVDPHTQVVAALGAVYIPSAAGDPGYKELESHGITAYVMKEFPVDGIEAFNTGSQPFFSGKAFLDLDEKQREQYLGMIVDGKGIADADQRARLQTFYRAARSRILKVYYSNYPAHEVKRNAAGEAILKPGDTHQISNPNLLKDKKLVTGWDIAGFKGPLGWEEEEQIRANAKKTGGYWFEGDLVKLDEKRPPASAAIKTSDGHDYYDVIVLGGGTAGCIVAGRIAERGINPKTGDRLKVAMIEGGDDWTIRDPGIKPGYGSPIRRKYITNINDGTGPDGTAPASQYTWPSPDSGGENFRLVGGCTLHYGGQCWIPQEEDFHFYREAAGVNWDLAKFGDAIQEIRDIYHVSAPPDSWWSKGTYVWADAGRALGYEMYPASCALRNSFIGTIFDGGSMNRFDSKGTSLPWAYIGLNNGLKVIPNAEIQKIVIEKVPGGRPVAMGAVYKDKAGTMHEVRAARVVVACAANWTPSLLYKSGYGPKELLGDKLLVENKNVGMHLTGDSDFVGAALLEEPVTPEGREGDVFSEHGPWCATTPRPWGELTVHIRSGSQFRIPEEIAVGPFAPGFGWDHKEYMRNGAGVRRIITWRTHLGAIPASWRVMPDGKLQLVEMDEARVTATIKQAGEIVRAWQEKLSVKPVKVDMRAFSRAAKAINPQHRSGTTRAGASPETSVCTSDFDCHDIDNLLFTSSSTIPKTFFWSAGPTAVNAAYAWRRMVANHFSTGSSTKGFA